LLLDAVNRLPLVDPLIGLLGGSTGGLCRGVNLLPASSALMRLFTPAICSSTYCVVAQALRLNPLRTTMPAAAKLFLNEDISHSSDIWSLTDQHQAHIPI
jgi:hypothetical protein